MKSARLFSLVLATASILSLTACGGKEDASAAQSSGSQREDSRGTPSAGISGSAAESSGTSPASSTTPSSNAQSSADLKTSSTPPITGGGTISGAELILDSGRSIMLSSTSTENGSNYAKSVNKYKETFPNVKMYSLIVPTAISYYLPEKFKQYDPDEKGHIDAINAQLKDVVPVDVYSVLAKHTDEPIYFNTDHHWTQLGAFYGAEEFAKTAGVDFKPLSEFDKKDGGDFVGSAYGNSGDDPKILDLAEPFTYYVPKSDFSTTFYDLDGTNETPFFYFAPPDELDKFGKYSLYMYGDGHIVHLNTSCKNGRRLLILKEAFANPFCCNLVNSFEDIWIADIKYMQTTASKLINDNKITDLLFCLSTYSTSGTNQEFLAEVL